MLVYLFYSPYNSDVARGEQGRARAAKVYKATRGQLRDALRQNILYMYYNACTCVITLTYLL